MHLFFVENVLNDLEGRKHKINTRFCDFICYCLIMKFLFMCKAKIFSHMCIVNLYKYTEQVLEKINNLYGSNLIPERGH